MWKGIGLSGRVAALVAALGMGPTGADADVVWLGTGGPPVAFSAGIVSSSGPRDTFRLVIAAGVREGVRPDVHFRIGIPRGLRVAVGDTSVTFLPGQMEGHWTLLLLADRPGTFELLGTMRVETRERRDEVAIVLPVHVTEDSVWSEGRRYTRRETIRGGRRYRYGDTWLVPLESDEPAVVEADIERGGKRAKVVSGEHAVCADCAVKGQADTVNFVVVVDRNGKVREARMMGSGRGRQSNPSVEAARRVLETWRFEPARAKGQAVSDWLYVRIPIRSQ